MQPKINLRGLGKFSLQFLDGLIDIDCRGRMTKIVTDTQIVLQTTDQCFEAVFGLGRFVHVAIAE